MPHHLLQTPSSITPVGLTFQTLTDTVSYCGPFEYSNGSLSRVNFLGGYVSGGVAYHYIHDHQGNVRQVVDATTGKVVQESHYYPGGMLFAESTATYFKPGSANNTYRYGGKELLTDEGLNLYQFGARMYDPSLLRFITPDPLRHETPHLSSYLYCAANPVMYVDPTGMRLNRSDEDERKRGKINSTINTLKTDPLFSLYFFFIEIFPTDYYIRTGIIDRKVNGEKITHPGYYDRSSKTIIINENNEDQFYYTAIIEETFHVFQDMVNSLFKSMPVNNIEYEAKRVVDLIMSESYDKFKVLYSSQTGINHYDSFLNKCINDDNVIDVRNVSYDDLNKLYISRGNYFVKNQPPRVMPKEYYQSNIYLSPILYILLYLVSPSGQD